MREGSRRATPRKDSRVAQRSRSVNARPGAAGSISPADRTQNRSDLISLRFEGRAAPQPSVRLPVHAVLRPPADRSRPCEGRNRNHFKSDVNHGSHREPARGRSCSLSHVREANMLSGWHSASWNAEATLAVPLQHSRSANAQPGAVVTFSRAEGTARQVIPERNH
jgi:hypothetical protein